MCSVEEGVTKKSPSARRVAGLPESLLRQINLYALGATATGVGFLQWRNPSRRKSFTQPRIDRFLTIYSLI
jgi:hypothetical protein